MKSQIKSASQFNLTNAVISTHTGLTIIAFPEIEHRTLSGSVFYPIDTQIVAMKMDGVDETFRIKVLCRYQRKAYANAREGRVELHDREPTEEELKSILA